MNYAEHMIDLIKGGGCFVSTRTSIYRASKRLTAEELGITELPKKIISLGNMKLLPDEICPEMKLIRSIENRINSLVAQNTFEFEGFGRYLKNANADVLATELSSLQEEFEAVLVTFEENYENYITDSVLFWGEKASSLGMNQWQLEEAVRESFVPQRELRKKFKITVAYLQIPDPARDAWKNCETEYTEMSEAFLQETMLQLRHEAVSAMENIATAMTSDKWNQKTLNTIPKMVERIRQMQIVDDEELSEAITRFQDDFITMSAQDYKSEDGELAFTKMKAGLDGAVTELKELANQDMKEALDRKMSAGGGRNLVF